MTILALRVFNGPSPTSLSFIFSLFRQKVVATKLISDSIWCQKLKLKEKFSGLRFQMPGKDFQRLPVGITKSKRVGQIDDEAVLRVHAGGPMEQE